MVKAKSGDRVKVHYIGTLDDGTVFDASESAAPAGDSSCSTSSCSDTAGCSSCGCSGHAANAPMEFVIGQGQLIAKFEEAVIGLQPGETVKVRIDAADAYGERSDDLIAVIERSEIPADIEPAVGDQMEVSLLDGTTMPVIVVDVNETGVTLDANHLMAGMDLNFEIRLLEIVEG